jgi:hypothetical protein
MTQPARAHSKIGASSAHRWFNCPASVRMSEGVPNTTSVYAAEGTAAHQLGEECLLAGTDAETRIGDSIKVKGTDFEFEVTEEMAEAVQLYLDTVRAEMQPHTKLEIEKGFHLHWIHPDAYGTNDACVSEPFGKLTVFDYKHGAGIAVDAEDNEQLMYYGVGAAKSGDFAEVEFVIVQPRASHRDGPVRRWTIKIDQLAEWEKKLKAAIERVFAPNAELKTGDHCRFCPAAALCPALKDKAFETAKMVFAPVNVKEPPVLPAPAFLSEADLKIVLDSAPIIEAWLKAVESYVFDRAMEGKKFEGYKLVNKRSSRKFADAEEVEKALKPVFGDKIYSKPELLSVAQMEKALGKEGKKILPQYVVSVAGGLTLAPEADKRPAANLITAEQTFSVITSE